MKINSIMKRKLLAQRLIAFSALILVLIVSGCDGLSEMKPSALERGADFKIVLVDSSGYMQKLYGTNRVANAAVTLKSNTLGTTYQATSDAEGVVSLKGLISDEYHISVIRQMSPDEMELVTGNKAYGYKLVNKKAGTIHLKADSPEAGEVYLDPVFSGSALLISEIYSSGPSGSGNYYHDKYVEIFNQSDSTVYLDKIIVALVYSSSVNGLNYVNDPEYIHSINIWKFPGSGKDYPIRPGQFVVCAEDAMDHRTNAPNSVDLSHADFEFYKDDAPDVDNPAVPNMVRIFQNAGNDWLMGGELGAIVIARMETKDLKTYDDQMLIPYSAILDGVEYMKDPSKLDKKILNRSIDAGTTGGIQFYTGKSMERVIMNLTGGFKLLDNNNSSLDFRVIDHPTPKYHY
ncbi:MAG: DUF4876 domain-containing protein [Ignavibacteria bacterium]|jgi:hypothetical protein|nr:DUF4876 domain-containing protein [Ignavibacteria bacterium]MCU7503554.1 DUF4876 domain-containing protein [Ignavibacteria bacterium]MCU7516792.1 DUF4876 domain-containing protein [Ignavibacteria bacterium]